MMGQVLVLVSLAAAGGQAGADSPRFEPAATAGEYHFGTGLLSGVLRKGGKSIGLIPVQHTPSQTALARSMGIFNYYRLFKTNHRFRESARAVPSTASLETGGSLRVRWSAGGDWPFILEGHYRWTAPDTLDLETTVTAQEDLPDFEVFLASYFTAGFPATQVYVGGEDNPFMAAEEGAGTWQAFPCHEKGQALVKDGRWTYPPSPVDWAMPARAAAPLAFRRDPKTGLVVIVMAPPGDAFAVLTPCRGEAHGSIYLSLFGRDVKAGETVRARSRFAVKHNLTNEAILELYKTYLESVEAQENQP